MQKSVYKSYDDLPLFLNAEMVAKALESQTTCFFYSVLFLLSPHAQQKVCCTWFGLYRGATAYECGHGTGAQR